MVGGGPFNLQPGQWTDDTSMALCLAESLIECRGFDPADQMRRYVRWWRHGHWSSTGSCFDIGGTVAAALRRFEQTDQPFSGVTERRSAGNGSLMRLAPVPIAYRNDPATAIHLAGESSRTTHGAPQAVDACRYFAGLLASALKGASKEQLLSAAHHPLGIHWAPPLDHEIDAIANGSFRDPGTDIRGSGYVVKSLEAALWAFDQSDSFEHGCLMAANLGDDADTTAAIYGQIAGAYYGREQISSRWRRKLTHGQLIAQMAQQLADLICR